MSKVNIGVQAPQFGDLEENPLGSMLNILFWNDPQRQIQTRVDNMEHTLLIGDYGTGWCRYHDQMSFCQMYPSYTGKTLILEAAAQSLSERENIEVVFVLALGKD